MSQQSVSKTIARLERELGFPLFIRTHHYVRMTKAGEEYYKFFSETERRAAELADELRHYYGTKLGALNVGYLEWIDISDVIASAVGKLRENHPNVRLSGEKHPHSDLSRLFFDRKLDVILSYKEFEPVGAGICRSVIMTTPLVLLVAPDNPLCKTAEDWHAFKNEPFIKAAGIGESLTSSRARAQRQCRELGFTPSETFIAPNLESAYLATELGQGVLVSTMLSRMSQSRELECYPVGRDEQLMCFWFEDNENPLCAEFAQHLIKSVAEVSNDNR